MNCSNNSIPRKVYNNGKVADLFNEFVITYINDIVDNGESIPLYINDIEATISDLWDIFRDHNEEIPDESLNSFESSHAFNVIFDALIKEILLILIPGLRAIIIKFQKLDNRSYTDSDGNIIVSRLQADKVIYCDYINGRLEIR